LVERWKFLSMPWNQLHVLNSEMRIGSYSSEKDGLMVLQNLRSRGLEMTINPLTFRTTWTCYTEIVLKTTP
jgi:hypothetical protein